MENNQLANKSQFRGLLAPSGEFYTCDFGEHERLLSELIKEYIHLCHKPYYIFENAEDLQAHFIYFNYHDKWDEVKFDVSFKDFTDHQLAWIMRNFHKTNPVIRKTILLKVKECSKQ